MQGEGPSSHFAKKAALQPFCMLQLLVNKRLQLWDKMLLKVVVKMWQNIKATLMWKLSTFSPSRLISNLNFRFAIPFRTNLAKYQPIRTDMGARAPSAILAFQSLNKPGPLVANYKIGSVNSVYTLQNQLNQISAHLDWYGRSKCHFGVSVT